MCTKTSLSSKSRSSLKRRQNSAHSRPFRRRILQPERWRFAGDGVFGECGSAHEEGRVVGVRVLSQLSTQSWRLSMVQRRSSNALVGLCNDKLLCSGRNIVAADRSASVGVALKSTSTTGARGASISALREHSPQGCLRPCLVSGGTWNMLDSLGLTFRHQTERAIIFCTIDSHDTPGTVGRSSCERRKRNDDDGNGQA